MRKSATINLNSLKLVTALKINYSLIIFSFVFAVGVAIGAFFIKYNPSVISATESIFKDFLLSRVSNGFFKIAIISFLDLLPLCLAIFLSGTSLIGVVLIPVFLCYKGVMFGMLSSYLYVTYLVKGIAFNALFLVPTSLITALTLIFCARISFNFSLILLKSSLPRGQSVNLYYQFQSYFKRYTLSLVFLMLSALLDALMSIGFIKLFNF